MRKELEVKIEEGRDKDKVFLIKELPALQMEKWAIRALSAIGKNTSGGVMALASMDVPDIINAFAGADTEKTEPLMKELLESCFFKKDATLVQLKEEFVNDIIEEWKTILRLQWEALQLNLGFLEKGDGSDSK